MVIYTNGEFYIFASMTTCPVCGSDSLEPPKGNAIKCGACSMHFLKWIDTERITRSGSKS